MSLSAPPTSERSTEREALMIFAVLWAVGALFHHAKWSAWAERPGDLAITVTAIWVLARPGAVPALLALFAAQVWALVGEMPHAPNSMVISGLVGLLGLATAGWSLARSHGGPLDGARLYRDFAPPARAVFLVLMFLAGFHKLNGDWFRPAGSCGALFYEVVRDRLPFLPGGSLGAWSSILGTLVIELAAPLLLALRRLRPLGIFVVAGFMFLAGAGAFFNFAGKSMALLFLFVPAALPAEIRARLAGRALFERLRAVLGHPVVRRGAGWAAAALTACALVYMLAWPWKPRPPLLIRELGTGQRPLLSYGFEALWWVYGGALLAVAAAVLVGARRWSWPSAREVLRHPVPALAVFPLLALVNGLSPYVGVKTENSFAMFSNLSTETAPNHFLIRHTADPFGFQRDLVRIETSSDGELRRVAERGYLLPYVELRAYVRERSAALGPDFTIVYVRGGERRTVSSAGNDPELTRPAPLWMRKLVAFRPVSPGEGSRCRH